MTDYRNFQVDDFIEDPLFLDWILENDKIAAHFWKEWLVLNPDRQDTIRQACEILLKTKSATFPAERPDLSILQSSSTEATPYDKYQQIQRVNRSIKKRLLAAAAVFVVASGIGLFFVDKPTIYAAQDFANSFSILPPRFVSMINTEGSNVTVPLSDGSTVEVSPGSELNYPLSFTNRDREVYLNGTAYFKIVSEGNCRPFRVNTPFLTAQSEGGFFNVNVVKNDEVTSIHVDSGNVHISSYHNFFTGKIMEWFDDEKEIDASISTNQSAIVTKLGEVLIKNLSY